MSVLRQDIGNNLKRIRTTNGLTQTEVAKALSIDRSTYTYYEKGRVPSIDILQKLSLIFDIPMSEILCEDVDAYIERLNTLNPDPPIKDIFLLPMERQLVMRFRMCSDDNKQVVLDKAVELAMQGK